jgi:pyruvate formate lyase activating enzyme
MKTPTANPTLADVLDRHTVVGSLWQREDDRIRCVACGHHWLIGEGKRGICKVRYHEDGQLRVPFGYVAGLQCDPVEKKPFFHVYPGSDALTFGIARACQAGRLQLQRTAHHRGVGGGGL